MSVSTDKHAVLVLGSRMPEPLSPRFGKNAKEETDDLRLSYPDFVPGRQRRIPAAERDRYLYCVAAAKYWEDQKKLAGNVIRHLLGDAEYAYTSSNSGKLLVAQRRKTHVDGSWTNEYDIDAIYPL